MNRRQFATLAGTTALAGTGLLLPTNIAEAVGTKAYRVVETNGDILALEVLYLGGSGQNLLAMGGNFTQVKDGAGVWHNIKNLVVVEPNSGRIIYGGSNTYVRALRAINLRLYVGTQSEGAYAIDVGTWKRWNGWQPPGVTGTGKVMSISAWSDRIYIGTPGWVSCVHQTTGAQYWRKGVTEGPVRVVLAVGAMGWVYVGGLFETAAGFRQHGLVALSLSTGAVQTGFRAVFRPDSTPGGYDGDGVLSLAWDGVRKRIVVGTGGAYENWFRPLDGRTGTDSGVGRITPGDCQAVAVVDKGASYFAGYHNQHPAGANNSQDDYGCTFNATTGDKTGWLFARSPRQGTNADGGNSGVQCAIRDNNTGKLYIGGAFTKPYRTLVAYAG